MSLNLIFLPRVVFSSLLSQVYPIYLLGKDLRHFLLDLFSKNIVSPNS